MTEPVIKTCGRPTRSGNPCKVRLAGSDVACGTHSTEQDRAVAEAHRRGYREGWDAGSKSGASSAKMQIEWLERRVKDLERKADEAARYYDVDGDQVVEVGRYAYRWRGAQPLEVGDEVLLPENYVSSMKQGRGPFVGTVSALGATYRGSLTTIIRRVSSASP